MFPSISTNSPIASLVPVCEVIIVGMVFELVADLRRRANDNKVNNQKVCKVSKNESDKTLQETETTAAQLKVGDVIKIPNGTQIPADCLVLSTGDSLGQCYINTAQLDGERNLKPKLAHQITQGRL